MTSKAYHIYAEVPEPVLQYSTDFELVVQVDGVSVLDCQIFASMAGRVIFRIENQS